MAEYRVVQVPELGEVSFFANLGALGEFEDYYNKPWYLLFASETITKKMWFVLLHKCYVVSCKRKREEVKHTIEDFTLYFTKDVFNELVPLIEKDVMDELGIKVDDMQKKTSAKEAEK